MTPELSPLAKVGAELPSAIRIGPLREEGGLPLLVEATEPGIPLDSWAALHGDLLQSLLGEPGGILLRGFHVPDAEAFGRVARTVSGELLEYSYAATPRTRISGRVYSSTEYPRQKSISLHNEMSYTRRWPMQIWFYCAVEPEHGGETPICDSRRVYRAIDPAVREELTRKRVLYVRHFGTGLDLSWEDAFKTDSRAEVERQCREAGIEFEWGADCLLTTRQVCQAVATHPRTGEHVWFNQAHLFHESTLPAEVRAFLRSGGGPFPRNACYGDGSPIEDAAIEHIRQVYERESIAFRWRQNDALMLDNMLVAHGRRPFEGARKILVALADPWSSASELR